MEEAFQDQSPPQQSSSGSNEERYVAPQVAGTTAVSLGTILNVSSWLLLFLLAPVTILVLVSQNTVPGDLFYPVKRGLEGVVLGAASVHPSTKAAFRVGLQARRFTEAEKLLLAKADTAGLLEFVSEVKQTQAAVAQVSDQVKKQEFEQKLNEAYDEYEKRLIVVKVQLEAQQGVQPAQPSVTTPPGPTSSPQPQPTNTPVPPPAGATSDVAGGPTSLPGQSPRPTNTAVPLPTSTQAPQPTATEVPTRISPTPVAQLTPPTAGPSPAPTGGPTTPQPPIEAVGGTIGWLECLRTRPHHECREPNIPQQHRQSEGRSEDREERREERRGLREEREEERGEQREKRREQKSE